MKTTWLHVLAVSIALLVAERTVRGHHAFSAEFDATKPITLTGTVAKIEWTNPHIWFYVDVKNPDGTITNWGFSGAPPGVLMRRGISKMSLKIGDEVIVQGFMAKDASKRSKGRA